MKERLNILLAKKLSGEATNTELDELAAIMERDNSVREQVEEIQKGWNEIDELLADTSLDFDTQAAWDKVSGKLNKPDNYIQPKKTIALPMWIKASGAIAAILVVAFIILNINSWNSTEFVAANGTKTIVLPDNSTIKLFKGSKITYDNSFGKENREVSLVGEAFFDIARDESKPFVINAEDVDVKVLGTSFYVESGNKAYVAVVTGKVDMSSRKGKGKQQLILTPGETGTLANGSLIEEKGIADDLKYWKNGKISFNDVALHELVTRLDKIFPDDILLSDKLTANTAGQLVTIEFTRQPLAEILQELCLVSDCELITNDDRFIIEKE